MEEPPRLERPLANVSVKAGDRLQLSCRVAGTRPTIVWLHNSKNLADSRDVKVILIASGFFLLMNVKKNRLGLIGYSFLCGLKLIGNSLLFLFGEEDFMRGVLKIDELCVNK